MPDSGYHIRKLEASDTVQNFKSGDQAFLPLKTFLQKQAQQFQQSSIAQTYVAVTDAKNIVGYVTLICSEIDLQNGYNLSDCSHANNYEFLPAVKIARLAVDSRYRNSGIGGTLIDYTIALVLDKIAENVGCRFVVTDAKTEAVDFYVKQGFTVLDSIGNQATEHRLMFLDLIGLK
jgi:ribosomal protein S18 acetylase RimI-like enzyme